MLGTEHLVRSSIIFLFFAFQLFAQNHPNLQIDSLVRSGTQKLLDQDYGEASETFNQLDLIFPENPLGNIYLAATKIAEAFDYEESLKENHIDSLLNSAKAKTDILLESDNDNLWYNYYDALIYGYRAYYNSVNSNIISAFAEGVLALRGFQNCLEIDKNFNESLIAIGIYKYWKSAQTKSFNWIPFVTDDREESIKILESAVKQDTYNQYLAVYSLIWIYIDYGESEKAILLAEKMLEKYGDSRFFRWGLARAYEDVSKTKAIEIYLEILNSIEKISSRNFYNDIVLKHKIAMLYFNLKEFELSNKLCDEILNTKIKSSEIISRLEERFSRVRDLKKDLEKNMGHDN